MKTRPSFVITSFLAATLLALPSLPAQTTKESQRQELQAARKQAISQNPELGQNLKAAEQALSEAHSAITNAMAQVDPNVVQIWADIKAAEEKVQSNPQIKADEKALHQLRNQLMNQDDPGYSSTDTNQPSQN